MASQSKRKTHFNTLSPAELQQHKRSMAFSDKMIRLTHDRIILARRLAEEFQHLTAMVSVAFGDLHSLRPMLDKEIYRLEQETKHLMDKYEPIQQGPVAEAAPQPSSTPQANIITEAQAKRGPVADGPQQGQSAF